MKLTALAINHFGFFEKEKIILPDNPLVIFYGSNESGKSTLMNYILSILFGFPTKNVLSRWSGGHPEGRFGGSIAFEGSDRKNYRMERFYQNREADLHDEQGKRYVPEAFFSPVDRLLFESVFCFDLDGLQGLDKIRPDDLNQLLLGAGMLGNHNLTDLEQHLDKQLDRLFKKGGKVPEINHLINQIDQSAKEIKVWKGRLDGFRRLCDQIVANKQQLEETEKKQKETGSQFTHWQRYTQLVPLIQSSEALEEVARQAAVPNDFPSDGREQYERLNESIQSAEKELAAVQDQLNLLDEQICSFEIDPQWFQRAEQLRTLHRDFLTDQQETRLTVQLAAERRLADAEYGQLLERLGKEWTEERLLHASVSVDFYQNLRQKKAAWKKLDHEKEERGSQLRLHR
ncbi:MAG: AAA family ATPase, partial [Methanobacterium paludis]|nr:AAA family ATPase [Methanobacterium paludis]